MTDKNNSMMQSFIKIKQNNQQLSMITCYDYPSACLAEACGLDCVLVGDSVGTNVLGYKSEKEVTIQDMIHHTKIVRRGLETVSLVADLPYGTYKNDNDLLKYSKLLVDAGADFVKFEGYFPKYVTLLKENSINVVCHLGLLPQTHKKKSLQANSFESAKALINQAKDLQKMGACMIILELVPEEISKLVTSLLNIPIVGIAAGRYCDGQVQIWHDVLGINNKSYKHISKYEDLHEKSYSALKSYRDDILSKRLLNYDQSFHVNNEIINDLKREFF